MAFVEIGNGWQSPRISFSVDLSQADRTSPKNRKIVSVADINYSTEFEFCTVRRSVNDGRDADLSETLISADELFVDGKILPQIRAMETQHLTIADHLSVESSRYPSPVRSSLYGTTGARNDDFKSPRRPSGRWKEVFKKDYFCATAKEADHDAKESSNDVKSPPSGRLRWPFSRSSGERRGNSLFCALPFSRSKSAVERKCKPCSDASCYRSKSVGAESASQERESLLVSGSKPDNTGRLKCEDINFAAKGLPDLPKRKGSPGRVTRSSPARNYGEGSPGRYRVRNSKPFDCPRPLSGRPMAEGSLKSNCNISMRVSLVLNMPALGKGSVGVRKNGRGLFGLGALFSTKNYRQTPHHIENEGRLIHP